MEEEGHHHGHHEHDASHHIVNKYLGSIFGYLLEVYFQQGHQQENVYYHKTLKLKTSYDAIISDDYFAIEYPACSVISVSQTIDYKFSHFFWHRFPLELPLCR
ncbi:MAG: hypothetical protein K8R74_04665 [Bacteroidales bacterium]|nr:hypothetical protein [Bacteroidales bacterium]